MDDLTADRWQRLDDLLADALARDPDERTAYLRAACGHDPALYQEALALLESADAAARALGESAVAFAGSLLAGRERPDPEDLAPGMLVGPYRVEAEAGRGGMGVVYRATRADGTFKKVVALKLVKRGMDTDEVLARFRREREVLAGLDHPAIARLLDAGAAADGRPYLVMEYVGGEPITGYCDRRRLGVAERLLLFAEACEAVQHAHRRLVVHRDLKPSNVLVAEDEQGRPRVKLLDFGIARLLDDAADEALTQTGRRRLTPAYASPEQVRGAAVTTAADVYALGVVLYELLAGTRPEGPTRPPSGAVTAEVAAARATTAERLRRRLRGDLDVIALKALREEAEARYPSVESLLDDIRRHRAGLPVSARPATAGYRVRRFVRRHRAGVVAAALVALALVGGMSTTLWQASLAARERDEAETFAVFLEDLLGAPNPHGEERLDTLSVREVLVRGDEQARRALDGKPLLQARLLHVIGRTYRRMRLFEEAEAAFEEALALRRTRLGPEHEDVAETLRELGMVRQARDGSDAGVPLLREALTIQRERLGARHPETAVTMASYASALLESSVFAEDAAADAEAEGMLQEALAILQGAYGRYHPALVPVLEALSDQAMARGDMEAAVRLQEEALALHQHLHDLHHPSVAHAHRMLAWVLVVAGQPEEAERHVRTALEVERDLYGEGSNTVRAGLTILASALRAQGRYDEAEAALREALTAEVSRPTDRAVMLGTLASVLREKGDLVGAAQVQREVVDMLRVQPGPITPLLASSVAKLADILREQHRYAEAEQVLLDGLQPIEAALGPEHPGVRHLREKLAALYEAWGRPEQMAAHRARREQGTTAPAHQTP
jgi:serine/threonine-protein kinase